MGLTTDKVTRSSDEFVLVDTVSWTSSNAWQNLFTPSNGEAGEIWIDFTSATSTRKFQKFAYQKDQAGTITFATSGTVALVTLGPSTTYAELQNSGGTIQVRPSSSSTCSLKWRKVVNAV